MLTDETLRIEAERLVNLDRKSRIIEAVAIALKLGKQSEDATDAMAQLDRNTLDAWEESSRRESAEWRLFTSSSLGLSDEI